MIEQIVTFITNSIQSIGYAGVFILMMLESMVAPIPSEAVMPFAGFLVSKGVFSFWIVVFVSSLASIVGSLISYAIGYYGGKPFVEKAGKYVFVNRHTLDWTEGYFRKKGSLTIFIARFIPVVRHLISIPAGAARMNLKRFILFTAIGATIWNTFLLYVGVRLAENWAIITHDAKYLDILVILAILAYIFLHVREPIRRRMMHNES